MKDVIRMMCLAVVCLAVISIASAVDIETVLVGNPGNAGEWSGETPQGGYGPNRVCGAVAYEYNIGKYEVTAGQYTEFLNAVDPTGANPYGLYNSAMNSSLRGCRITWNAAASTYDFSGRPSGTEANWENRPVNYVSWYDAAMFANWATSGSIHQGAYDTSAGAGWGSSDAGDYTGTTAHDSVAMDALVSTYGRVYVIPTEDEWYKAAYYSGSGSTYYDYPTSTNSVPSNDLVEPADPGNNATFNDGGHVSPYTIGYPYYRTEVGEHENSDSPYGTFDQGGNVWEWNETILWSDYRGLRGGSFDDDYHVSTLHASYRYYYHYLYSFGPTDELNNVGFRVSEVPEPATMAILALGGIGILGRRKCVRG